MKYCTVKVMFYHYEALVELGLSCHRADFCTSRNVRNGDVYYWLTCSEVSLTAHGPYGACGLEGALSLLRPYPTLLEHTLNIHNFFYLKK